jgi:hypothetical protein
MYWELMDYRMALDEKAEQNKKMLDHTNLFADDESRPSLEECKVQILKNLQVQKTKVGFSMNIKNIKR